MKNEVIRLCELTKTEKGQRVYAGVIYTGIILSMLPIWSNLGVEWIGSIIQTISVLLCTRYIEAWLDKIFEWLKEDKLVRKKKLRERLKSIFVEILKFIPILILTTLVNNVLFVGEPENQTRVVEIFLARPVVSSFKFVITGPLTEELLFRAVPYKCIKNKRLYVIISAFIFAAMHVVDDANACYYIWCYIFRALYYGYRYHKTNDIAVPFAMHSLNNLTATLLMFKYYF